MLPTRDTSKGGTKARPTIDGVRLASVLRAVTRYELADDAVWGRVIRELSDQERTSVDAATGRRVTIMGGEVVIEPGEEILSSILALRKAPEAHLLAWVREYGLLGTLREAEPVEDMRYRVRRLATAARLRDALASPRPNLRRLHRLARLARGGRNWLRGDGLRWDAWSERAARVGIDKAEHASLRPSLAGDLDAHEALVELLQMELEVGAFVWADVRATRYTLRMRPALAPGTPLAAAMLYLYGWASSWQVGRLSGKRRTVEGRALRTCETCGHLFQPRRRDQKFHSKQCQYRGLKRRKRERERTESR